MSTKLIDISKQLKTFLASDASSILLKETNGISGISIIEAHIQKRRLESDRSGKIILTECSGNSSNCLNIVNVAVAERSRRKGLFTDFLELLERFDYSNFFDSTSAWCIRIDNVMNPVLDDCLPRKGYDRVKTGDVTHFSYQKIIRQQKKYGLEQPDVAADGIETAAIQPPLLREEIFTGR
ncbi:MAG: hypothetical protein EG822_13710 [Deltaproteobacteria bacterium]|nr:hypothetical protein [Deltaproteobacteria bacterium]TLN01574.1 MAG: hypothetical protein FDZ73_15290 [bacterium]